MYDGVNASVFTHYTFVVWYAEKAENGRFLVDIVGVEVIGQQPTLIEDDLSVLVYSYSVSWKLAPDAASSSQFPKWSVVSHSEWFVFANTVAVLLCSVLTIAAFAVLQMPFLAETEEQLTTQIAQRHSSVEPASLPLKFLSLYVVVALIVFCTTIGVVLLGSTALSLFWGSGSLYRFLGVMFPLLVAITAFLAGFSAIQVSVWVKEHGSIITLAVYVAGISWLVFVPLMFLDIWFWGAKFLPLAPFLMLALVFLVCCFIMWLGAFAARWLASPRKKTPQGPIPNV